MLTSLRGQLKSLSWILWLVIIALSVYVFNNWGAGGQLGAPTSVIASVDGNDIQYKDYVKTYKDIQNRYRKMYGQQYNSDIEKFLRIGEQSLNSLINNKIMLLEAEKMGINVTEKEIADKILSLPVFKNADGSFIGQEKYNRFLASNGLTVKSFEKEVKEQIITEKFSDIVRQSIYITTEELRKSYRDDNEKTTFDYITFKSSDFKKEAEAAITDEEVAAYFEANKESFKMPLKRKINYVMISPFSVEKDVEISEDTAKAEYDKNLEKYTQKAQVKASHILIGTTMEKRSDADAFKIANKVKEELNSGKSFEDMVKQYSDDKGSAAKGGDLGYFPQRGQMVEPFADAAFALEIGEVSDLVKTQFGYHIIKCFDKKEEKIESFEEVKASLISTLKINKAKEIADQKAKDLQVKAKELSSIEKAAEELGYTFKESPFFENDSSKPVEGFGILPSIVNSTFSLNINDISPAIGTAEGNIVFQVKEEQQPYLPELDEVKAQVKDTIASEKAYELAKQKAEAFRTTLSFENFKKKAEQAGLEIKTVDNASRLEPNKMIFKKSSASYDKIFDYEPNQITEPMKDKFDNTVLCLIKSVVEVDNKKFEEQLNQQRADEMQTRSNNLFSATIENIRTELEKQDRIFIKQEFLQSLNNG